MTTVFLITIILHLIKICCGTVHDEESCQSIHNTRSNNGSSSNWKWDPSSPRHRCNIHRISQSSLLKVFGPLGLPNLYPYPLVITPDENDPPEMRRNSYFANLTSLVSLPKQFPPDFTVTLTGSDSLSSHRKTVSLRDYLHETVSRGETLPNQLGNETWYLFGETFTLEWEDFLRGNYNVPYCHSCTSMNAVALSFGVGNIGSGVQWHTHGPGFSETIHGRKHWVLYPPQHRPNYDLDYASRHWMEYVYPTLDDWSEREEEEEQRKQRKVLVRNVHHTRERIENGGGIPSKKKPFECTIHEAEMIYFPDGWHHATINLEKYTVFVSSFTSEHDET